MLRNGEITALALFTAGTALAGTAACLRWPAWGWACALAMAAVLALGYGVFTAWRYAQLKKLAAYLAAVYGGQRVLDIRDNREGELSLLKNDLYKITVTLQRQADRLEADRGFLARSLGDISHRRHDAMRRLESHDRSRRGAPQPQPLLARARLGGQEADEHEARSLHALGHGARHAQCGRHAACAG